MRDIFGPGANLNRRLIKSYEELEQVVGAVKSLGMTVALTSGTWDLKHVGHDRYLEQAKNFADVLIVGVDSDEKVKKRKGPNRPTVPEQERLEQLCHLRHVDLVFLKGADDSHGRLIQTVKPDVLVVSKREYPNGQEIESFRPYCGRIEMLDSQAETSTTARIRSLLIGPIEDIKKKLLEATSFLDTLTGRI